jgi:16S rRNA (guanine527-N7)-methyltransferase
MNVSRETLDQTAISERLLLIDSGSELKIDLSNDQTSRLLDYLNELRRWNQRINLIGPAKPEEQVVLHLVDSLVPLKFLPDKPLNIMDLGSGAGLPGIVLAIMRPQWKVTMVEARAKKADFIQHTVRMLGIDNAKVSQMKLGKGKSPFAPQSFDLITFRALGHLKDVIPLVAPYLKTSGQILAYKGPEGPDEWNESKDVAKKEGLKLTRTEQIVLPKIKHKRVLLFLK